MHFFSSLSLCLQVQNQLKKLHNEMKDLLQSLGLKQSGVSIERWKGDVLEVARGLSVFFISTERFAIAHFFQYYTVCVCGTSLFVFFY